MKRKHYLLLSMLLVLSLASIITLAPRIIAASNNSLLVSSINTKNIKSSNSNPKKIQLNTKLISSNNQHSKPYSSTKTKPREKRNQIAKYGDIFFRIFGSVFVTLVVIVLLFSNIQRKSGHA
ncbi:hypothetical protein [Lactococcus petauri]|uniref:hypothetical protein n=1 Tax=Lactococcus petauri TaxID=1940789 RepID=UPI00177D6B2F|nr:hypothetical protein [Lactococcus petauri]MBD5824767.1 hypothetical protein [Lactococcus petauri]